MKEKQGHFVDRDERKKERSLPYIHRQKTIDMTKAEPHFPLVPHLLPSYFPKPLENLWNPGYPHDKAGIPELRQAISHFYERLYGYDVPVEAIAPTYAGRQGISRAAELIKKKAVKRCENPRVLMIVPTYYGYINQFKGMDFPMDFVNCIDCVTDEDFLRNIHVAVQDNTFMLVVNSPHNPTGKVYSENLLRGILQIAKENSNLHIISDVANQTLVKPGSKNVSLFTLADSELRKKVFEVSSLIKVFGIEGGNGWLLSDPENIRAIVPYNSDTNGRPNNISSLQVISALEYTPRIVPNYHEEQYRLYQQRMKYVTDRLNCIEGINTMLPESGYIIFVDFREVVKKGLSEDTLVEKLRKRNIVLNTGKSLKAPGFFRLSANFPVEKLKVVCDAITDVCTQYGLSIEKKEVPLPKDDILHYNVKPYKCVRLPMYDHQIEEVRLMAKL